MGAKRQMTFVIGDLDVEDVSWLLHRLPRWETKPVIERQPQNPPNRTPRYELHIKLPRAPIAESYAEEDKVREVIRAFDEMRKAFYELHIKLPRAPIAESYVEEDKVCEVIQAFGEARKSDDDDDFFWYRTDAKIEYEENGSALAHSVANGC